MAQVQSSTDEVHLYKIKNKRGIYMAAHTNPTQENYGRFAFYVVDGKDNTYKIYSYDADLWISYTKAGSYNLTRTPSCTIDENGQSITHKLKPLTLAVKVANTQPAGKLSKTSVSLNRAVPNMTAETVINCTDKNYTLSNNKMPEITYPDNATADAIAFAFEDGVLTASIASAESLPAAGSYSFKVEAFATHNGSNDEVKMKPVTLTVKVENTQPTAKLSKATVTVNNLFPSQTQISELVPTDSSFKVKNITCVATGNTANIDKELLPAIDTSNGGIVVSAGKANTGSYTFTVNAELIYNEDENTTVSMKALPLTVKVVNTQPKVTLSTTVVSLSNNPNAVGAELASIQLKAPSGYSVVGWLDLTSLTAGADDINVYAYSDSTVLRVCLNEGSSSKAGTYKFSLIPIVKEDASGDTAELKAITFSVKVYAGKDPSAAVSASGKLDAVQRDSGAITYTLTKLSNIAGTVVGVKLEGQDKDLFSLAEEIEYNAKNQPTIKLKLVDGTEYVTNKTYKVKLKFLVARANSEEAPFEVYTNDLSVKVTNTAIKFKTPAAQTIYQSQSRSRTLVYKIELTSPEDAELGNIEIGDVGLLQRSLVNDANVRVSNTYQNGKAVNIYVTIKDTSALAAGKSYTLPLLIKADGCAENVAATKLNLSLKVLK